MQKNNMEFTRRRFGLGVGITTVFGPKAGLGFVVADGLISDPSYSLPIESDYGRFLKTLYWRTKNFNGSIVDLDNDLKWALDPKTVLDEDGVGDLLFDFQWLSRKCFDTALTRDASDGIRALQRQRPLDMEAIPPSVFKIMGNGSTALSLQARSVSKMAHAFKAVPSLAEFTGDIRDNTVYFDMECISFENHFFAPDQYALEDQFRFMSESMFLEDRGFRARVHGLPPEMEQFLNRIERHPFSRLKLDDQCDWYGGSDGMMKGIYNRHQQPFSRISASEKEALDELRAFVDKEGSYLELSWEEFDSMGSPHDAIRKIKENRKFKVESYPLSRLRIDQPRNAWARKKLKTLLEPGIGARAEVLKTPVSELDFGSTLDGGWGSFIENSGYLEITNRKLDEDGVKKLEVLLKEKFSSAVQLNVKKHGVFMNIGAYASEADHLLASLWFLDNKRLNEDLSAVLD